MLGIFPDTGHVSANERDNSSAFMELSFQSEEADDMPEASSGPQRPMSVAGHREQGREMGEVRGGGRPDQAGPHGLCRERGLLCEMRSLWGSFEQRSVMI